MRGMSETFSELRRLSDDEVIDRHDQSAQHTMVGVSHHLQELARREAANQLAAMTRLTERIYRLTALVAAATVVNDAVAVWLVMK